MVIFKRKTPGGKVAVHSRREKTSKHTCGICSTKLHGTARGTTAQIRKLSKSQRRPARPYGGNLCSKCLRNVMTMRARLRHGDLKAEDVPISMREYVK